MKAISFVASVALMAGLAVWSSSFAQAPANSTGECKDGTYTQAESKRGACRGHGGIKQWYAEAKSESKSEKSSKAKEKKESATPAAAAPAAAPAAPKSTTTASAKKGSEGMGTEAAPGGGAGKVWVNTSSKVYHCQGDRWYGKTKQGEYMTESAAKAAGNRPDHGKACT